MHCGEREAVIAKSVMMTPRSTVRQMVLADEVGRQQAGSWHVRGSGIC